jgi:hypothetical protein
VASLRKSHPYYRSPLPCPVLLHSCPSMLRKGQYTLELWCPGWYCPHCDFTSELSQKGLSYDCMDCSRLDF